MRKRLRKGRKNFNDRFKYTSLYNVLSGKMVLGEDEKLIRVKIQVHKDLTDLRAFPDRANYSDVIAWLINEYKENEHTKELLK